MSVISIRLPETLLNDLDHAAKLLHVPRAQYIRKAIEALNKELIDNKMKKQMIKASLNVRKNSMQVNTEFDEIENDENF